MKKAPSESKSFFIIFSIESCSSTTKNFIFSISPKSLVGILSARFNSFKLINSPISSGISLNSLLNKVNISKLINLHISFGNILILSSISESSFKFSRNVI